MRNIQIETLGPTVRLTTSIFAKGNRRVIKLQVWNEKKNKFETEFSRPAGLENKQKVREWMINKAAKLGFVKI